MKKLILALTIASATSLFAGYTQWFTANLTGTPEPTANWQWTGEDGSIITNDTNWEIDAAVTTPATFTPTDSAPMDETITEVEVTTTFDAFYDMSENSEDPPTTPGSGAYGAIIVGSVTNNEGVIVSSNYYAYVRKGTEDETIVNDPEWVRLYGAYPGDVANVNESARIKVELLFLSGVYKIRFSVYNGGEWTALYDGNAEGGNEIFDMADPQQVQLSAVDFIGCGKVASLASTVRGAYFLDGGQGTADDPYVISNELSFIELAYAVGTGNTTPGSFIRLDVDELNVNAPMTTSSDYKFDMSFDGNGNTINFNDTTGYGFFGILDGGENGITISNLTIAANVTGGNKAAAFASNTIDNVTLQNCKVSGGVDTCEDGEMAAGFVIEAIASDASNTSVTFDNCAVDDATIGSSASAYVAFVGEVTQGAVQQVGTLTVPASEGTASVPAYSSVADEDASVPQSFNFYTNCTFTVEETECQYSFFATPDVGNTTDTPYIVATANADTIVLSQPGCMYLYNPVVPDSDPEVRYYTGAVKCGSAEGDPAEVSDPEDDIYTYTYVAMVDVTVNEFTDSDLSVLIKTNDQTFLNAPGTAQVAIGTVLDITWTVTDGKVFGNGETTTNYTHTVAGAYLVPEPAAQIGSYTITYYVDDVEDTSLEPKQYDGLAAVNLPTPTAETDCSIFYWYTNSAFKGVTFTTITAGTSGDKTFYAKNIKGEGDAESPYEMSDEGDLTIIQGKIEDGTADDKCVKQTDGIELTAPFAGLGTSTSPFTGIYDGDGKALTVSSLAGTGFFNFVKGATIKGVELTVQGGAALALVGTATADAAADTAVTISACTNKTSAIDSGAAFIATVTQGKAVSSGKLEANAKYTSIGSVTAEDASESDFNFATVSDSTASYVADDDVALGTDYKVMLSNDVTIVITPTSTTAATSRFDFSLATGYSADNITNLYPEVNTVNKTTEGNTITCTGSIKPVTDGVFAVQDSGSSGNKGNMKFDTEFISKVAPGVDIKEDNREAIETALNADGANGIPEWQNYAMGLSTATELATANKKPIAAAKQTADSTIVFSLGGINPPSDSGAFITYKIKDASSEVTQYGDSITIDIPVMSSSPTAQIQVEVIVNQANPTAK